MEVRVDKFRTKCLSQNWEAENNENDHEVLGLVSKGNVFNKIFPAEEMDTHNSMGTSRINIGSKDSVSGTVVGIRMIESQEMVLTSYAAY